MDKCAKHCPCCGVEQNFNTKVCSVCKFDFSDIDELKKRLNIIDAVVGLCKRDKYQEAYNKLKEIEKTKNWETIDVENYKMIGFFDALFKYKHDNRKEDFTKYLRKNKDVCAQYNVSPNFIYETICGVLTELDLNDDEKDKDVSSFIDRFIDEGNKRGKNGFSTKSFIDNIGNKSFDEVEERARAETDIITRCDLFDTFIAEKAKKLSNSQIEKFVKNTIKTFDGIFEGLDKRTDIDCSTSHYHDTVKNTFKTICEIYNTQVKNKSLSIFVEFSIRKKIMTFYKIHKKILNDK